jgi:hypothetical protein
MTIASYRYSFDKKITAQEIETTLILALLAIESLYGTTEVRLDGRYRIERKLRTCVIDAQSSLGRDLNRVFIGFLSQEFGGGSFTVERIHSTRQLSASAQAPMAT